MREGGLRTNDLLRTPHKLMADLATNLKKKKCEKKKGGGARPGKMRATCHFIHRCKLCNVVATFHHECEGEEKKKACHAHNNHSSGTHYITLQHTYKENKKRGKTS